MASADIIGALGAGSGVDVKALAQSLVDVEKMPREEAINTKIDDQERRIAGYSALMLSLENVKKAFQKLNDLDDFNASTISNSASDVVSAVATSAAVPGRHTIEVQRLAAAQRHASGAFASPTVSLNGGNPFSVNLTLDGDLQTSVRVASDTPQGVVDAINDADQGVKAQLIDTGDETDPYKIILSGPIGSNGVFSYTTDDASGGPRSDTLTFQAATGDGTITVGGVSVSVTAGQTATEVAELVREALAQSNFITGVPGRAISTGEAAGELTLQWATSDGVNPLLMASDAEGSGATVTATIATEFIAGLSVTDLDLEASELSGAVDALVVVDGVAVTRGSNAVDDIIPGVYLDLLSTNIGSTANIRVARDTATIKENLQAVVDAYNDAVSDIAILAGARSDDPEDIYSGSLQGDSTVRRVQAQLRGWFTNDSSTPGSTIAAFRDLGLDIDRNGVMSIDAVELESALSEHFDDIVTAFTANTNRQSEIGVANRGIAGDAVKAISDLINARGLIATQSTGAQARVEEYQEKIDALNLRMEALLARYTKQFGIMNALVGQTNAMRESLKSTFEGMMSMYTKK